MAPSPCFPALSHSPPSKFGCFWSARSKESLTDIYLRFNLNLNSIVKARHPSFQQSRSRQATRQTIILFASHRVAFLPIPFLFHPVLADPSRRSTTFDPHRGERHHQAATMARVYADYNQTMPRSYWDYDSVNISELQFHIATRPDAIYNSRDGRASRFVVAHEPRYSLAARRAAHRTNNIWLIFRFRLGRPGKLRGRAQDWYVIRSIRPCDVSTWLCYCSDLESPDS